MSEKWSVYDDLEAYETPDFNKNCLRRSTQPVEVYHLPRWLRELRAYESHQEKKKTEDRIKAEREASEKHRLRRLNERNANA